MKQLYWHPQARHDADEAAAWYAEQGGLVLEIAFVEALQAATAQISRHPGIGSNRYADLLKTQALRFWSLKKFPHLLFYIERETQVDILRVLHAQRDIPAWMGEGE